MTRKKKRNLLRNLVRWPFFHPWLKLIALILAIILWFYAKGEMSSF
ncbi:MAG: hypothetical protein WC559_03630 [Candidatus Omnitrophota bacterium]